MSDKVHETIPSPIHRLPPEIMSDIFLKVDDFSDPDVVDSDRLWHGLHRSVSSTGSRLGSVCVYWRRVTLSTPGIWASLQIEIKDHSHCKCVEHLQLHIERSRSAPLSISFKPNLLHFSQHELNHLVQVLTAPSQATSLSLDANLLIQYKLVKMIMGQTERIRHLSLYGNRDSDNFILPLFLPFQNRFPLLEHITVAYSFPDDPRMILNLFASSPRIHSFGIRFPRLPNSTQQDSFPYSRMTNVHIGAMTSSGLWSIFHRCPNLGSAIIVYPYSLEQEQSPTIALTLVHLKTLCIVFEYPYDRNDLLLDTITFPVLSSLSIGMPKKQLGRSRTVPLLTASFISLVSRCKTGSASPIKTLRLDRFPCQRDDVITLMENLPSLLELEIREPDWVDPEAHPQKGKNEVVSIHFLNEVASGRILPRLKNLRMVVNNDWVESDAFESMIESRPQLESIYLEIGARTVPNLDLDRLQRVRQGRPGQALRVVQQNVGRSSEPVELLGYRDCV